MRPAVVYRVGALATALGLLASLSVSSALAASITVNSLGDSEADDGVCTLREAINAANTDSGSGPSVGECGAGWGTDAITFSVSGTITLTFPLPGITTDLSIDGAGAITVSGASSYRVLDVAGGTVTLSGLTITAGGTFQGGGIFNTGTLTVSDSTISGNTTAFQGGGIFNTGTLTVTNSMISGNTADFGGGIYNIGTLTVTNSMISGNIGSFAGGGILNIGILTVTNSTTISGNFATLAGGGILNNIGTLTLTNSTISGNTASEQGGGIANGGTLTLTNSTISGNSASGGGGIANGGTFTLTNSTISGNSASGAGGGLRADVGTDTLVNAIIAGNMAPIGPDIDGVAETTTTSIIGVPGGMTLADILDPAGLADNGGPTQTIALALVASNPAIDLGTGAVCAAAPVNALDQRGMPRPTACDIGAYEAQPPTVAAHADVSVPATSLTGAVITYSPPAGTDEQGGVAAVACLPSSGSTFAPGTTTVTCTAPDAVGHTATGTFQVIVGAFATATPSPTASVALLPNTAVPSGTATMPSHMLMLGLLGIGLVTLRRTYRRDRLGAAAASRG